ncbi:ATP-grasp domain-containing protein [Streptomyces rhizosphaerihabitans]|uniref:ATP-grasp domain-containing protein n=1 Tax=Streptomyces rhizosphaerihabitans TaxID=1266770 RepID=UPI0021C235E7|nr:ATP-grasp domain-containing protein [Streptomyces rhizosphaerihabitans]MCT9008470.1 ATP-grasp domain-containing protein [Streptomyces rhizosphaerihabitans]
MQRLLLVGVGLTGRPYAAAARRLGVLVHAVETAERAESLAGEVDDITVCRGGSDELWAEAASAAVRTARPDGVVAFSEPHVLAAALIQDELGLPGPSLRAASLSRNKALQRARFAAAGIGQPGYLVTERLGDVGAWAAEHFPVVVKPLSSAGSAGVELVQDAQAYGETAARRACEGRLLVEQAVTGPEFSWEALVRDGKVWFANLTAKETTGPPYFVETQHRTAVEVDDATRVTVSELGTDVVEAMGMRTGIVHLEFRLTERGPAVMEVAVRTPGDRLMDLLALAYDVDWYEMVVRMALGMELPEPPRGPVRYAASYLPTGNTGVVTAVEGFDSILAHPCVVDAEVTVGPGDVIAPARSSGERVGQVVLVAEDRAGLESALDYVRRTLVVTTGHGGEVPRHG